ARKKQSMFSPHHSMISRLVVIENGCLNADSILSLGNPYLAPARVRQVCQNNHPLSLSLMIFHIMSSKCKSLDWINAQILITTAMALEQIAPTTILLVTAIQVPLQWQQLL